MEIPSHFSITGFDPDLNKAFEIDLHDMIDFITNRWNLSREDAYRICSTGIDCNISHGGDVNKSMHGPASKFNIHRGLGKRWGFTVESGIILSSIRRRWKLKTTIGKGGDN